MSSTSAQFIAFTTSKISWILALLIGVLLFNSTFLGSTFGVVNNVYVGYYKISYITVDWFILIYLPGTLISIVCIAYLLYSNKIGFRNLSISNCFVCVIASITLLIASAFPKLYPIIFIGQFLKGLVLASYPVLSSQLSNHWFSRKHSGKALGIVKCSMSIGVGVAVIVPSHILIPPASKKEHLNFNLTLLNNSIYKNELDWRTHDEISFLVMFGCSLFIGVVLLFLVYFFAADKPGLNPNEETLIISEQISDQDNKTSSDFFKTLMQILHNKEIYKISFILAIRLGRSYVQHVFFSEIMRPILSKKLSRVSGIGPNEWSSYMLVSLEIGAAIGNIVSSIIFDLFRRHKRQIAVSLTFVILTDLGFLTASYFENIPALWSLSVLLGFVKVFATVPSFDAAVQTMLPINSALTTTVVTFLMFLGTALITQACRFMLIFFGSPSVFIYTSILFLFGLIMVAVMKPVK